MRLLFSIFFLTALLLIHSQSVNGDVLFSQSANDLVVDITAPINLTATAGASWHIYTLNFEDVFSVPTASWDTGSASGDITMSINGGPDSTGYSTWAKAGDNWITIDQNDFYGNFVWDSAQTISPGDTITVSPGTVTLSNYFPGGILPDVPVSTAQVAENGNYTPPLTDPVLVPEPSSLTVLGIAAMASLAYRRRKSA